jgi:hypothetical protein
VQKVQPQMLKQPGYFLVVHLPHCQSSILPPPSFISSAPPLCAPPTPRWTHDTSDGSLSAQFEYTLAVRSQEEGGGCEVLTPALWDQQQGQRQLEHQHQQ